MADTAPAHLLSSAQLPANPVRRGCCLERLAHLKHRFRSLQISRVESFAEAIVYQLEYSSPLCRAALRAEHSSKACRSAQFPGKRIVLVRPLQRYAQVILCSSGGGRPVEQEKLAFDAEELAPLPMLPAPIGAVDYLVNHGESLGDATGTTQSLGELGDHEQRVRIAFAEVVHTGAQLPHAVCDVAAANG